MRKLATAAFSFSLAIFASNYIFDRVPALYAALFCAVAGACLLACRLRSLRGAIIAVFAASLGFFVFSAHYDLTVEKAHALDGQTQELRFELLESTHIYEEYSRVEARLAEKGMPRLRCILYDYEGRLDTLSGGDVIRTRVKLSAADIRYGEKTDRYTAKDVYLTATVKDLPQALGHRFSLAAAASSLSGRIAKRVSAIFPADTAPFIKALILGDKSDLYRDDALYVALSRAGLMHVAAVSGMHVSYLVGFLRFVFGKGKKSALLCLLLVWCFVALSGMSPSALRAAFMQSTLLLAPLVGRENDPLTSLSAALAVLLLINPFSAANISLQLSFAAMLGIITLGEAMEERLMLRFAENGAVMKWAKIPLGVLCCSLAVMAFTIPITAAHFGYVTLLGPLSNLLCLWAVPICFVSGFLACGLSVLPMLGSLLARGVSVPARGIFLAARLISSLDFSVVYLTHRISLVWIVLLYLAIAAVFFFKLGTRWKIVIPIATAIVSLLGSHTALLWYYSSAAGTIAAIDVGQGQCVAAFAGEGTVVADCGSISYAEYNAGDEAAAYLKSCGRKKIDALIFTHPHADHANGLERLANLMTIDKIVFPASTPDEDALREIMSCALRHGIRVESVSDNRMERCGDVGALLLAAGLHGDENESCMPLILTVADYSVIITGDAPAATERELVRDFDLSKIDALIVGHHGSKSASCEEYLRSIGGRRAIISVGKNSFGHPAAETLERLRAFGYAVSETDKDGTVEIRIHGKS